MNWEYILQQKLTLLAFVCLMLNSHHNTALLQTSICHYFSYGIVLAKPSTSLQMSAAFEQKLSIMQKIYFVHFWFVVILITSTQTDVGRFFPGTGKNIIEWENNISI